MNPMSLKRNVSSRVQSARKLRVVALTAIVAVAGLVVPASAQEAPAPRILPTAIPAGYVIDDYFDRKGANSDTYFVHLLRDPARSKEFFIGSIPTTKTLFDENILAGRIRNGAKKTKVRGLTATVLTEDGETEINWFEKNRWMQVSSIGSTQKLTLALALNVVPTKLADASFAIKKKPAGVASVYVGQIASLTSSGSGVLWTNANDEEIELDVTNVVANYIDIVFLSPGTTYVPTTVNGKPGYVSRRLSGTTVAWMEQPNLLVEVRSTEFNEAGVQAVAASLVPVDEAAWNAAVAIADQTAPPSSTGGDLPVNTTPVAAGTLNGVPWVATVNGQCLVFSAGGANAQTCIPGFTAPNSLSWNVLVASGKTFAVGITGANVVTVVGKVGGAEVARTTTQPVANQAGLKYFIVELPAAAGATFSGLDAAGAEISPAVAVQVK